MKKSTFTKKFTVAQLIPMTEKYGIELDEDAPVPSKTQLVDMIFPQFEFYGPDGKPDVEVEVPEKKVVKTPKTAEVVKEVKGDNTLEKLVAADKKAKADAEAEEAESVPESAEEAIINRDPDVAAEMEEINKNAEKEVIPAIIESSTEFSELDASDVMKRIFSAGLLYKIDAKTWWGKSSKSRKTEIEKIDSGRKVASVVKTLINPKHLGMVKAIRGTGERALKKHSFPFLGIRGVYFVPKTYISELEDSLRSVKTDHDNEIIDFVKQFPKYQKEWAVQMGDLYDESLYPNKDALRNSFKFSWTKFRIDVPNDMLTADEYQEELEKQKSNLVEFVDETISSLAAKFYELMTKLKDRVDTGDDVSMKQIISIKSFLDSFVNMNISKNSDLEVMAEEMRTVFDSVDKTVVGNKKTLKKMSEIAEEIVNKVETSSDERISRAVDY